MEHSEDSLYVQGSHDVARKQGVVAGMKMASASSENAILGSVALLEKCATGGGGVG